MQYLAWLLKRFNGNLTLAAAGYNAGEGAVDKYKGVPPYSETQRYVQRVGVLADATGARWPAPNSRSTAPLPFAGPTPRVVPRCRALSADSAFRYTLSSFAAVFRARGAVRGSQLISDRKICGVPDGQ